MYLCNEFTGNVENYMDRKNHQISSDETHAEGRRNNSNNLEKKTTIYGTCHENRKYQILSCREKSKNREDETHD